MKIVVVGPGALGSLLAASIALRSGQNVWLLDHDPGRAAYLNGGILLNEDQEERRCPVRATADAADIGPAEAVLLCVKSYDVSSAIKRAAPLLTGNSLLISFQNGIGHHSVLAACDTPWALAVTAQGATLAGTGQVRHAGRGRTWAGFTSPPRPGAAAILKAAAALLNKCGIETLISRDIIEHVWTKLLVNAGINALTAIMGCTNGDLLETPEARERLEAAVMEAAAVAGAKGIPIKGDPLSLVVDVCRATSGNISSMLQDVKNRRPTEIDAINGAIVEEAHRLGLPVPVNEGLVMAVKDIERGYGQLSG